MSDDAYVWVDLEFPAEPKDTMARWKQTPLDPEEWHDWGPFGPPPELDGFATVAAVLAQAARHAALQRLEGAAGVFHVAMGPTQVKIRAALTAAEAPWWWAFACLARVAAGFGAAGEFGWLGAARSEAVAFLATVGAGESRFRPVEGAERQRIERHRAVTEITAELVPRQPAAAPPRRSWTAPQSPTYGRGDPFAPRPERPPADLDALLEAAIAAAEPTPLTAAAPPAPASAPPAAPPAAPARAKPRGAASPKARAKAAAPAKPRAAARPARAAPQAGKKPPAAAKPKGAAKAAARAAAKPARAAPPKAKPEGA